MSIEQPELARRLRAAREAAGLTQDQAASALGIARPGIAQLEKGRRSISGLELDRLAALYGTDVQALLRRSEGVARFRIEDFADMPGVADALEQCLRVGRDLADLERMTGADHAGPGAITYDLPIPAGLHQAIAQGARTAAAERRRRGRGDGPVDDVVDLLEANGMRTAAVDMPDGVAGIMLADAEIGALLAVNRRDHVQRRAFSFVHEYAHALFDRSGIALVSRNDVKGDLREIRANSFAAAFLMPEAGVRRRLAGMGKGVAGTIAAGAFDDVPDRGRAKDAPAIQLHDVALLAHGFGVSRLAMLNRLRSLRAIAPQRFEDLREADLEKGAALARLLALPQPDHAEERARFDRRYVRLALEAHVKGCFDAKELARRLTTFAGMDAAAASDLGRLSGRRASSGKAQSGRRSTPDPKPS